MLGLGRTGVRTVPSADLDLDELDPCAVLVVGDRSAEGGLAASAMVAMATTTVAELGDGALESDLVEVVADELLTRYGTP